MKYTIVVTYSFSPEWLQKSWEARAEYEKRHVRPIFAEYASDVQVRFFDAEAFSARFSDFMILETTDLKRYYYLIEALRDSPLFKDGLVEFKDIFLGIEDGFQDYEREVRNL
ncbi:hypothetical protein N8I74_09085 [Chitiniphilus purpureus]|uniref:Darcynin 1 n=1 Tax=Chitiniphilus purpureus TaxID=2981137 RepID=A0ABY6DZ72_9NEIS|nr:darcynin family protein [Chitiniphilus sp. CD1]UXY17143.1 hypothetical protein N8I74_09085 [Chitiniphilus sp. CD1]